MTTRGGPPIPIRVQQALRDLGADGSRVSVLTLEKAIGAAGGRDRRDQLNRMHQELWRKFEEGALVLWHDGDGNPLRERTRGLSGSRNVTEPLVFGVTGSPAPEDGLVGLDYQEHLAVAKGHPAGDSGDGSENTAHEVVAPPGVDKTHLHATEDGSSPPFYEAHDEGGIDAATGDPEQDPLLDDPGPDADLAAGEGVIATPLPDPELEAIARRYMDAMMLAVAEEGELDFTIEDEVPDPDQARLVDRRVYGLLRGLGGGGVTPEHMRARAAEEMGERRPVVPEWFPHELLASYLELPEVHDELRTMRTQHRQGRNLLRFCGFPHSGPPSPEVMRAIASHVHESAILWRALTNGILDHHGPARVVRARLALLDRPDPLDGYLTAVGEGQDPSLLAFTSLIDLDEDDEDAAQEIAAEAARALADNGEDDGQLAPDALATLEERLDDARTRAREYRRELREAGGRERKLERRIAQLEKERETAEDARASAVAALQGAQQGAKANAVDARRLEQALQDLAVRDARISELDAATEALTERLEREHAELAELRDYSQDIADKLGEARTALDEVRQQLADSTRLRESLSADRDRLTAREAELLDQLRIARENIGLIPTPDDPGGLAHVLARAVGPAVQEAGARLSAGAPRAGDDAILELAGRLAVFIDAVGAIPAPSEDGREAQPHVAEEARADVEAPSGPELIPDEEVLTGPAAATPEASETAPAAEPVAEEELSPPAPVASRREPAPAVITRDWLVQPMAGGNELGGSAILVTAPSGATVLLDCGQRIRPGMGNEDPTSLFHYGIPFARELAAICITHAHADHIGSLPRLHRTQAAKQSAAIPVLMSAPTKDLAPVHFANARALQRQIWGTEIVSAEMVSATLEAARTPDPYERVEIADGLQAWLIPDVWHVLGSCAIGLHDERAGSTLIYTGDLGPVAERQLTMPASADLGHLLECDVLLVESTNGGSTGGISPASPQSGKTPREDAIAHILRATRRTLSRGGSVLFPVKSLGPAQEMLAILRQATADEQLPNAGIYAGGLIERYNTIYDDARRRASDGGFRWVSDTRFSRVAELAARDGRSLEDEMNEIVTEEGPAIILAGPNGLDSGWSEAAARVMLPDEKHTVILTDPSQRVRRALRLGRDWHSGGDRIPIRAGVLLDHKLEAHASGQDLRHLMRTAAQGGRVAAIGLVHGVPEAQSALSRFASIEARLPLPVTALENDGRWQAPGHG